MRAGLRVALLCAACRAAGPDPVPRSEGPHPELVEVRPSHIPGAGDGLFAKVDIPARTYLGFYAGTYVTEAQADAIEGRAADYLFFIPPCANEKVYDSIAGDMEHYVSKVNFGPKTINGQATQLQNVDFDLKCEEPYARLYSTRAIGAGEELLSDYGPEYPYDFMDLPAVQDYFLGAAGIDRAERFDWDYAGAGETD